MTTIYYFIRNYQDKSALSVFYLEKELG